MLFMFAFLNAQNFTNEQLQNCMQRPALSQERVVANDFDTDIFFGTSTRGSMAYGYITYPESAQGFYKWDVDNIHGKTVIKSGTLSFYGGTYYDHKVYVYEITGTSPNYVVKFQILDPATGNAITTIPRPELNGSIVSALTYDYTSNEMYALRSNGLYKVNLTTGELSSVASLTGFTSGTTMLTLAVRLDGAMYAINSSTATTQGNLYSVNKTTGACTSVGATGMLFVKYAQSMAFDPTDNQLYWACSTDASPYDKWTKVNTTTGLATIITPDTYEINFMYFPYDATPTKVTITTAVTPEGAGTVAGGGEYEVGAPVTLTATANSGYEFEKWTPGNSTANPLVFNATENATYTANFKLPPPPPCKPVTEVNAVLNEVTKEVLITWTAPDGLVPTHYKLFDGDEVIGEPTEMSHKVDVSSWEAAEYTKNYCVLPVFAPTVCEGDVAKECKEISFTLSIKDYTHKFSIRPNPATNDITITSKSDFNKIEVVNFLGQTVITEQNNGKTAKLDISTLTNGVYFVRIATENGASVMKFVKQ